ncbi:MAG: hypothetical protein ACREMB_00760 [Candidatus Rokuibacteriota bacterium]
MRVHCRPSVGVLAIAALLVAGPAAAQPPITIGTISPSSVNEGDDFFSDVTHDPRDFDVRRDILWEESFQEPVTATGGIWQGTFAQQGGYIFPLFRGFTTTLNTGATGARFPLDASKYTFLSTRNTADYRSAKVVFWSHQLDPADGTIQGPLWVDGPDPSGVVTHPPNQFVVDLVDLGAHPSWTGAIRQVRLDPSTAGPPGTTVRYDWVRLTDPGSAPMVAVDFSASGGTHVDVYVASQPNCSDAAFLKRVPRTAGVFSFPSAALPPGTYFFRVELRDGSGALLDSDCDGTLTVDGKPRITFENPSITSGPDYATTVLGNPWDLDGAADVANLDRPDKNFFNEAFVNSALTATAIGVPPSPHSDSQVWMTVDPAAPIDTRRYRYLTYQIELDPAGYGNIADKVARGWFSRIIWWDESLPGDGSATKGHVVYEGLNTLSVDLAEPGILALEDPFPAQTGWRANPTIGTFRLDMTETPADVPTGFALHDVKLTGNPEPEPDGSFTVQFQLTEAATVQLFRDTDAAGFDGAPLGAVAAGPGPGQHTVGTAGLFPGDYWIYAVVTDPAGNTVTRYADVPLRVPSPFASGIGLALSLTQPSYQPGETLVAHVTVSNPDSPVAADVFMGILLPPDVSPQVGCPAGDGVAFFAAGFAVIQLACVSDPPQTFEPLVQNVVVHGPMAPTTLFNVVSQTLPAGTPPGVYTLFLVVTTPGAFADGGVGPAELLAIATVPVPIGP